MIRWCTIGSSWVRSLPGERSQYLLNRHKVLILPRKRTRQPSCNTIFQLVQDINKTNVLTKFHDDKATNVTSRVFTRKTARPPLRPYINKTNVFTKFHDDWANHVTSRVFTSLNYPVPLAAIENCPALGRPYINKTNVLTKFHDDWAKFVTSKVFTRKTAPPTGGHVFQRTGTTFKLNQHIIKTNILTKIH
ncbi:hypothetical protein DPMN_130790 [Dreissena polymorpha]|uniref:Uncharacterized protein n=1 Tax=Dreissena polymorpha TaxID=45954 RepID=A0A9D4H892_DREPO|nr:hypothetical protein DPMN_130790 [Dreissena polymorpha]